MSLTNIGGNKAYLVFEIDMPDMLLPGVVMAIKHYPGVFEFKHENELDQSKELVKTIDEE